MLVKLEQLFMLNKFILFLIVAILFGGLGILVRELLVMDVNNQSGDPLSIAGAILFSSALIALSIYANRKSKRYSHALSCTHSHRNGIPATLVSVSEMVSLSSYSIDNKPL